MALVFLSLGGYWGIVSAMLNSIQIMKFSLRTGWGKSLSFTEGNPLHILHSLCQGNGTAQAAWLVLSSVMVRAYNTFGYGSSVAS
jgi:hypothetical protein